MLGGDGYIDEHFAEQRERQVNMKNGLVNGKASDTYAQLTREQYDNWLTTFYPKQRELMEKTQNGDLLNQQLSRVDGNMVDSMRASEQAKSNQMARYGVATKDDPNQGAKQALATATAKNSLREYEKERSMSALAGSSAKAISNMEVE